MKREFVRAITVRVDSPYRKLVDKGQLRAAAAQTLLHQDVGVAGLTLVVTGDERIRALNQQYRGLDAPTDVLAFAAELPHDTAGVGAEEPVYLGDVVMSFPRAAAQAQAGGHPVSAELQLLVVHGVLHLLGHDHAATAARRRMWAAQSEILRLAGAPIEEFSPSRKLEAFGKL